jgi:hypothetical protein
MDEEPRSENQAAEEKVRDELRRRLKEFQEGLVDDPVPVESWPQIEAKRCVVMYSGPVPTR